jgi:hypothetical protein
VRSLCGPSALARASTAVERVRSGCVEGRALLSGEFEVDGGEAVLELGDRGGADERDDRDVAT